MNPRRRKCKSCRQWFHPIRSGMEPVCSGPCALEYVRAQRAKKQRAEHREAKRRIKPRSKLMSEAQRAYNEFIRLRDANQPCISCGEWNPPERHGGAWDCGHYLSVGSHPELRFEERNAYKQCKSCNGGSANFSRKGRTVAAEYRERLIERVGIETVEFLEGPHEPKHYTADDLIAIRDTYRAKVREMKRRAA